MSAGRRRSRRTAAPAKDHRGRRSRPERRRRGGLQHHQHQHALTGVRPPRIDHSRHRLTTAITTPVGQDAAGAVHQPPYARGCRIRTTAVGGPQHHGGHMATSSLATTFGLQFYPDETTTTATTTGGGSVVGGGGGGAVDPLAARPPVAGLPVQSSNTTGNSAVPGGQQQQQPMYATSANRSTSPLNSQNHLAHPFHMSFPVTQTHNIGEYLDHIRFKIIYPDLNLYAISRYFFSYRIRTIRHNSSSI